MLLVPGWTRTYASLGLRLDEAEGRRGRNQPRHLNPERSSSVWYSAVVRSRPSTPRSISRSAHLPMKSRSWSGITEFGQHHSGARAAGRRTLRRIAIASSSGREVRESWARGLGVETPGPAVEEGSGFDANPFRHIEFRSSDAPEMISGRS